MNIRPFREPDRARVVELWDLCGLLAPGNDPNRDIDMKLAFQPEWLLVGEEDGQVLATVMAGYEGHRGWINYLAVDPGCRRKGYGREMMAHAEQALFDFGCPKINLQVRAGNEDVKAFYEAIGYLLEDRYDFGKRNQCH
jgi:ribosomal protein S18 acetylase RimI-like enzyme